MTIENLDANKSAQEREEGRRKPLSPFPFPRKHPKRFRVKNLRENRKYVKIVHLMPNVLTSFNIGCGITAILFAINGKPDIAAMLILLAAFFDMIDGKVARFVGAASPFGIQLDSLADVISFGVTPPLLLHSVLYPDQLNRLSLSLVLIYTLSTTRLFSGVGGSRLCGVSDSDGAYGIAYCVSRAVGLFRLPDVEFHPLSGPLRRSRRKEACLSIQCNYGADSLRSRAAV